MTVKPNENSTTEEDLLKSNLTLETPENFSQQPLLQKHDSPLPIIDQLNKQEMQQQQNLEDIGQEEQEEILDTEQLIARQTEIEKKLKMFEEQVEAINKIKA